MKIGEIIALSARALDYGEKLKTNPVENYPEYQKWVGKALKDLMGCSRMLGDNRKRLRRLMGIPAFVYRGEFRYDCWFVGLGLPGALAAVLVLTAKGKGTCYEVVTEWDGKKTKQNIKKVLEFMEMVGEDFD